jgi:hypothetical protein
MHQKLTDADVMPQDSVQQEARNVWFQETPPHIRAPSQVMGPSLPNCAPNILLNGRW